MASASIDTTKIANAKTAFAWLSLGANIGNPAQQIATAVRHLDKHEKISLNKQSAMLVNPAWGKTDQPDFHNIAIEIATDLTPIELLDACQNIENIIGRERIEKWGPRLIDIDIIAYDRIILQSERLNLPHQHAFEREFVLGPLREISPATAKWLVQLANS